MTVVWERRALATKQAVHALALHSPFLRSFPVLRIPCKSCPSTAPCAAVHLLHLKHPSPLFPVPHFVCSPLRPQIIPRESPRGLLGGLLRTEQEELEVEVIRKLVDSYFCIVRKTLLDQVCAGERVLRLRCERGVQVRGEGGRERRRTCSDSSTGVRLCADTKQHHHALLS